jgi:hypothetical protein
MLQIRRSFLRETRDRCRSHPDRNPQRTVRRRFFKSDIDQFGHPIVLLFAAISPILISLMNPGPRHFAWACLLFVGIAWVAQTITSFLFEHPHLLPFSIHPADESEVFHRQFALAGRKLAGIGVAFGIGFGTAAWRIQEAPAHRWLLGGATMAVLFPLFATS